MIIRKPKNLWSCDSLADVQENHVYFYFFYCSVSYYLKCLWWVFAEPVVAQLESCPSIGKTDNQFHLGWLTYTCSLQSESCLWCLISSLVWPIPARLRFVAVVWISVWLPSSTVHWPTWVLPRLMPIFFPYLDICKMIFKFNYN